LSSKSVVSDTTENVTAERTAWWDEQISLLAQRLSAGKRNEQLQQRLADVAQQIVAAQRSASPGVQLIHLQHLHCCYCTSWY
jgi:hypothetical protein